MQHLQRILFVLYVLQSTIVLSSAQVCPVGTVPLTDTSRCLLTSSHAQTFPQAQTRCKWSNGIPLRIRNVFENNLAVKAAQNAAIKNPLYIGIAKVNGRWQYSDDDAPISYTNWAKGQPMNQPDYNCAILSTSDSMWRAAPCATNRPFFCEIQSQLDDYCTNGAKANILFMIEDVGNKEVLKTVHEALFGFYQALPTQWFVPISDCHSDFLNSERVRISGLVYYNNTYIGNAVPGFCDDQFQIILDGIFNNLSKAPISDISMAVKAVKQYTEQKPCDCRRRNDEGTKQIMIWIPMQDQYLNSNNVSLNDLPTWDHYLLPVQVWKANATFPLWLDPRMKEITQPDFWNFVPTLAIKMWELLCQLTGQNGPVPPPPFI